MASNLIKNIALQQRTLLPTIRTCQRSIHTSLTHFSETATNNKKPHTREPTRFVQIESLPNTATSEDIRKLAREAFPKGDQNIIEMLFTRTFDFNVDGRCIVAMSDAKDARRLLEYGNRRLLGGKVLKMNYIGSPSSPTNAVMSRWRRSELISMADGSSAAGRSVIIRGLPPRTAPEHVLGYLRSKNFFPIEGTPDNVLRLQTKEQAVVSKFLVKFDSESEAWRCVRAFHNTDFLLQQKKQTYKLKLNVAY